MKSQPLNSKKVAIGISGGIAAYKTIEVLRGLQRAGCEVRVAMTRHACEFIQPLTFRALSGSYVVVDDYSADNPDPIAHITFSQTVDLFVIAPATANTLAKLANGVADDFITSTYLACTSPVLVAPAMNTVMWQHPATRRNIEKLRLDGVQIIEPDAGEMACGTIGPGRLSAPERIVSLALELLEQSAAEQRPTDASQSLDLASERILITAGATREPIDPVRFISNRSSGKMGFALAEAARKRGAKVCLVRGFTSAPPPSGVELITANTAEEMRTAVLREIENATIFIATAAVADYRPKQPSENKIKKNASELTLELERTPDILSEVARQRRPNQLLVGFAAETEDVTANAQRKLHAKNLDIVVANDVSGESSGFDSDLNAVTILVRDNPATDVPLTSKLDVANRILDEVAKMRRDGPIEMESDIGKR
ncbi:MAG TPA: bifunctional phosphopantothenoylcysteine decarboxylase/phosphopantothenate--cysteine ligase CoaBC [Pyrinomonadaceae bacterium]|nr:bifunctional phosphopantothenoylcysteine decarboxylase/phosphopantothenate--cysteine ligase CoaBC [Pyrinomonadaceae bacterium]